MLKNDYPISLLCDLLTVSRSSFYYRSAQADESELREAVNQLAAQFPTYGSRRLAAQLRRAPYELTVNRKRVQRVMRQEQINCRVRRRAVQTTDSKHTFPRYPNLVADLEITRPDQVWVSDEALVGLRAAFIERLDNGVAVAELRRRAARAYAGKKRVLKEESERRPALRRWRMTIADVYIPDQPQGAAERVRRWAATIRSEL